MDTQEIVFLHNCFTCSSRLCEHEKKCNAIAIEDKPFTESDVLNKFMYNPDNEASHSGIATNKSFIGISAFNIHEKRAPITTQIIDSSMCQKANEIQEYPSLYTEIDIKEDIYDHDTVDNSPDQRIQQHQI